MSAVAFSLHALARALGGEVVGNQVLEPGPSHSRRDRSLSVRLSATAPEGFLAFSHSGDDFTECRDYIKQALGIDTNTWHQREPKLLRPTRSAAELDDRARAAARTQRLITAYIRELAPVRDSPGDWYLRVERGIDTDAIADVLERVDAVGWHPGMPFYETDHPLNGKKLGCIIGIMTDPVTALPTGAISRTYLHDGNKLGKAKSLGEGDGVVRLSPDDEVTQGLHLAEGLESALSAAALGFRPIWSTGSTSILAKFPDLSGIEALTVFADNDANGAGERAADKVAARWLEAGREARVIVWDGIGDINDALRAVRR